jgi:dTDP-4-dehydrorhamnose reductase
MTCCGYSRFWTRASVSYSGALDWMVLTAAYTDVDGSEQNCELAFAVNGGGMKNVDCVAQEDGAKVFYVRNGKDS